MTYSYELTIPDCENCDQPANYGDTDGRFWCDRHRPHCELIRSRDGWLPAKTAPTDIKILMTLLNPEGADYHDPPFVTIGWVNSSILAGSISTSNGRCPLSWLVAWMPLPEPYSP